jgi:hypothetical protein
MQVSLFSRVVSFLEGIDEDNPQHRQQALKMLRENINGYRFWMAWGVAEYLMGAVICWYANFVWWEFSGWCAFFSGIMALSGLGISFGARGNVRHLEEMLFLRRLTWTE